MAQASRRIPKIPKKVMREATKEPRKVQEFSGDLDGGTLWQVLGVEENLVRRILLLLNPVDLINLEKTSAFVRNLIIHFNVWKEKFNSDFSKMETLVDIAEKLEELVEKADKVNSGNVLKSDHWCFKLKYAHCWNLEKNWEMGQYIFTRNKLYSHKKLSKNYAWKIIHQHILLGTKHTAYREELFCHKSMKNSDNICESTVIKVVEVSDKHLLLFTTSAETFKVLLIEKNSLEVLAICFYHSFSDFWPQQFRTSLLDKTSCLIVHSNCNFSEICVVKFMLDAPKIWIEEIRIDGCLRICSVRGPYSVGCTDDKIEVLHFDLNNVPNGACSHKVWEKDMSSQNSNSFPKIRFLSAFVNFPFVYVSKSNGLLEVWDVTKDEVVKTVDKTDILGSIGELKPCYMEENRMEQVLCLHSTNELVVLNGKVLKNSQDSPNNVGYTLNGVFGARDLLFMDNTCIVNQGVRGHICKFDFWPIYPGNFKVKSVKCEDKKKPKKRKLLVREPGGMTSKNVRVESESEYSDNEEEYHYHEDDLYDYGVDRYDDHDQFYDDDNFVDEF